MMASNSASQTKTLPDHKYYKCCIVPICNSTTVTTPNKLFFNVPKDGKIRRKWCIAMKRDLKKSPLSAKSSLHICEDHFNLELDMINYMQYQLMGQEVKNLKLKSDVVPHIFTCQKAQHKPEKGRQLEFIVDAETGAAYYLPETEFGSEVVKIKTEEMDSELHIKDEYDDTNERDFASQIHKLYSCISSNHLDENSCSAAEFGLGKVEFKTEEMETSKFKVKTELNAIRLENSEMHIKDEGDDTDASKAPIDTDKTKQSNSFLIAHDGTTQDKIWRKVGTMFECLKCDYRSGRKSTFQKHLLTNGDELQIDMFECSKCDYKSKRKHNFDNHLLSHQQTKLFQCSKCDYKCNRKDRLNQHLQKHADPSLIDMFGCSKCDYKSNRKSSVKQHLLIHADPSQMDVFECSKCDYKSNQKRYFRKHVLRHADPT